MILVTYGHLEVLLGLMWVQLKDHKEQLDYKVFKVLVFRVLLVIMVVQVPLALRVM